MDRGKTVVRGCSTLPGFDPANPSGPSKTYFVNKADLEHTWKHVPWKVHNLRTVANVLSAPDRVYRGVRDDPEGWGLCFCGKPKMWYNSSGGTMPFPEGAFFCVFVNDRDVVYEWRAEEAEGVGAGAALELRGCRFRFEEVLWTRKKP